MTKKFALSFSVAALIAGSAWAQSATDGPTLEGETLLNVQAAEVVNAAVGNESSASQEIGNIDSGTSEGALEVNVQAGQSVNAAVGNKACADQKIGTIGGSHSC